MGKGFLCTFQDNVDGIVVNRWNVYELNGPELGLMS